MQEGLYTFEGPISAHREDRQDGMILRFLRGDEVLIEMPLTHAAAEDLARLLVGRID
jgi:hypothetical protein